MASAQLGFLLPVNLADRSALAMAVFPAACSWRPVALAAPAGPCEECCGGWGGGFTGTVGPLDGLLTLPVSQTVCCAKCVVGTAWEPISGGGRAARGLSGYCALVLLLVCLSFLS